MSRRRAPASESQLSPASEVEDVNVEMKDRPDATDQDMDAEGEVDDEGSRDLFQTISDLSTYLCTVEEE